MTLRANPSQPKFWVQNRVQPKKMSQVWPYYAHYLLKNYFLELIHIFFLNIVSIELRHSWNNPTDLFMFLHKNGLAQTQNQAKCGIWDPEDI